MHPSTRLLKRMHGGVPLLFVLGCHWVQDPVQPTELGSIVGRTVRATVQAGDTVQVAFQALDTDGEPLDGQTLALFSGDPARVELIAPEPDASGTAAARTARGTVSGLQVDGVVVALLHAAPTAAPGSVLVFAAATAQPVDAGMGAFVASVELSVTSAPP